MKTSHTAGQIEHADGRASDAAIDERLVLIVDDDLQMLDSLESRLEQAGYDTLRAVSGEEALACLSTRPVPIVIADCSMPGMDGIELCRRLRAIPALSRIYFIVLIAHEDEARVIQGFEAGVNDFLTKSLDPQELLGRLNSAWRIVELERTLSAKNRALEAANADLIALNQRLQAQAMTDALTGLVNRRAAMQRLEECFAAAERYCQPLSVLMIDIDRFKRCNDRYGHDAGDALLRAVARHLKHQTRESDIVCRIGGEEFLIICPHTRARDAAELAERIRREIGYCSTRHHALTLHSSVSIGVAERGSYTASAACLLKCADRALYDAKRSGRNRVCLAKDGQHITPHRSAGARIRLIRGQPDQFLVLVVDDNPSVRRQCRSALERHGCRVIESSSGENALAMAVRARPDVIVLDEMMPMSGLECARRLKEHRATREIPILVSSVRTDESVRAGLQEVVDEYIAKPLGSRELVTRVTQLARGRRNCIRLTKMNRRQRRQASVLRHLLELYRTGAHNQIAPLLDRVIDLTGRVARARCVAILLPDADHEVLRIARASGMEGSGAADEGIKIACTALGQVFSTGRPALLQDPADFVPVASDALPAVAVPLIASGAVIGVMVVAGRVRPGKFRRDQLSYIDLIASTAGSVLYQIQSHHLQEEMNTAIVSAMATLTEFRDNETGRHIERVTRFSLILAEAMSRREAFANQIDATFLAHLKRAVPLHDIGKVAIPDRILLKRGPLEPGEMEIMRRHTEIGAQTIDSLIARRVGNGFLRMARAIALCHHEWYDGSGYPRGLRGAEIPLVARIASLADVYDALTTRRVYKPSMSHAQAVEIIRSASGTQFDPAIVEAFLASESLFARTAAELTDDAPAE